MMMRRLVVGGTLLLLGALTPNSYYLVGGVHLNDDLPGSSSSSSGGFLSRSGGLEGIFVKEEEAQQPAQPLQILTKQFTTTTSNSVLFDRRQADLPRDNSTATAVTTTTTTTTNMSSNETENDSDIDLPTETVLVSVDTPCPKGYICSRYGQMSCEEVQQIPISMGLGDIHAGIYCPGRDNRTDIGYQNCEVGYYCPDPITMEICPEGFYCPYKTATPDIKCRSCPMGATSLTRPSYAYTLVVLVIVVMILVVLWNSFKRYNQQRRNQLRVLRERHSDGLKDVGYKRRHLKKLKELKPLLKLIEKRLRREFGSEVRMDLVLNAETDDGKIIFRAEKLFDILDKQKIGELKYSELNTVLKLSKVQLREFKTLMNEAAGEPLDTEEVERHLFVTQFLRIYEIVTHLDPSPETAAQLFDEIARQGVTADGEIPHRLFYTSPLAEFLKDSQINAMLKDFQRTKELHGGDDELERPPIKQNGVKGKYPRQVRAPIVYRYSLLGLPERNGTIGKDEFVARYPKILADVTRAGGKDPSFFTSQFSLYKGVDLSFEKLRVAVKARDRSVRILSNITGRLVSGTMTAVMGGSGSGKTTLLHALSGRTFSGSITGEIKVNGHHATLQQHSTCVGFVPKDDSLYGELTVRENFLFSGMFRLPEGTPMVEIEDFADITMAILDLCRVMHCPLGDMSSNGLSDVQKKLVSIGVELMSRPRILFLEGPTSKLDTSSALHIMRALKNLVNSQGITVCSSLEESRRDVFELFDSLILLGLGGKLVYHGPTTKIGKYFNNLNYYLPAGVSLTDWLLDICTGRVPPPVKRVKRIKRQEGSPPGWDTDSRTTLTTADSSAVEKPKVKRVTFAIEDKTPSENDLKENLASSKMKPFEKAPEQAKATCELLHEKWVEHVKGLSKKKLARYEPPVPFALPRNKRRPSFVNQLGCQLLRLQILVERNWLSSFVNITGLVLGVTLISWMDGPAQPTRSGLSSTRNLNYDSVTETDSIETLVLELPSLFAYAIEGIKYDIEAYSTKVGVLFSLVVGIIATKTITAKRNEFFRDSASGYSVNAYFCAISFAATVEHCFAAVVASLFAFCLRASLASWYTYVINFIMLSWISASWGILFALLIPERHVMIATAFIMAIFGLLFSGVTPPINFKEIYDHTAATIASGLLSPTRYFIEAMAVAEARSLPAQSGFTNLGERLQEGAYRAVASFQLLFYGQNDFDRITQRSFRGWFWGALPSLFVGLLLRWLALGTMHASFRLRQRKKPFLEALNNDKNTQRWFGLYVSVLAGLLAGALVFMLKKGI